MKNLPKACVLCLTACVLAAGMAYAASFSIPKEEVDENNIYLGSADNFENPAEVDYLTVVTATPEYAEIKAKKIESGSARYYILMSEAGDHAVRIIKDSAEDLEYDFVAAKGYLKGLKSPITAKDITKQVLKHLKEES